MLTKDACKLAEIEVREWVQGESELLIDFHDLIRGCD